MALVWHKVSWIPAGPWQHQLGPQAMVRVQGCHWRRALDGLGCLLVGLKFGHCVDRSSRPGDDRRLQLAYMSCVAQAAPPTVFSVQTALISRQSRCVLHVTVGSVFYGPGELLPSNWNVRQRTNWILADFSEKEGKHRICQVTTHHGCIARQVNHRVLFEPSTNVASTNEP